VSTFSIIVLLVTLGALWGLLAWWWAGRERRSMVWDSGSVSGVPQPDSDEALARIMKRVRRIELITRGMVKESLGGQYHSKFKGQGIEFDDFREYQAGDDVRFIDWNVTARMNDPFVRKYVEERELTVLLLVDVSGSADYGSEEDSKRELAAEMAAMFAFSACANQDKVGLVLFSDQLEAYVPARKGHAHSLRLVRDVLNCVPRSRGSRLQPALDLALQRIAHRSLIVIISDLLLPDTSWEHSMRALAMKHDVVTIRVTDPKEMELPLAGRVTFQDPETGGQLVVNTSSAAVRAAYASELEAQAETTQKALRRCGVESMKAETGGNHIPALRSYFKARRRRK
jgi:uncharacterized protein (DUF58 family)